MQGIARRRLKTLLMTSAVCLFLFSTSLSADEGIRKLEDNLTDAARSLLAELDEPEGERIRYALAVVPFSESGRQYHRRLGITAAEIVEDRLTARAPDWIEVQSRMNLPDIFEEHRLWVSEIVEEGESGKDADRLLERADFLIVGTTTVRQREVDITLRLVDRRSKVLATERVSAPITSEIRPLLAILQGIQEGAESGDVAVVRHVELTLWAQRMVNPFDGTVSEWVVEDGEKLRGGDQIRFEVTPDADCYLYVFMYGSDDKFYKLFPTDDWEEQFGQMYGRQVDPDENYCRAEYTYYIPGVYRPGPRRPKVHRYYRLGPTPGDNIIYVAAGRKRARNLSDLRRRLERIPHERRKERLYDEFDYVDAFRFEK